MNFIKKFIHSSPNMADRLPTRELRAEPEKSWYVQCLIFLVLLLPFSGWTQSTTGSQSHLEKIRQRGELRVITRSGSMTHCETATGTARLDCELARLFARRLGVEARFSVAEPGFRTDRMVAGNQADLAAGAFADVSNGFPLRFGPVYRQGAGWVLPMNEDVSLYVEVQRFFAELRATRRLEQLLDRYAEYPLPEPDQFASELGQDFKKRLPGLKHWFVRAGRHHALDWRLLAAIAYQESRWQKQAVSPEGVRGLMMLTQTTARELGVRDRTDPASSIMGAAEYLRRTLDNIPAEIADPDRTWYALAAYNLGYTHIERARQLVRGKGGNPDMWVEIRKVLPRMNRLPGLGRAHKKNHRGTVAVEYVDRIRQYYHHLVGMTTPKTDSLTSGPADSGSV